MKYCYSRYIWISLAIIAACFWLNACLTQSVFESEILRTETPRSNCRLVQHELGEACIPQDPQRIVLLDEYTLDPLIALGIKPIAAAEENIATSRRKYLNAQGIPSIGKLSSPSIEKVVNLNPDLILRVYRIDPSLYKILSQVAPTVKFEFPQPSSLKWKEVFYNIAETLDRTEKAEDVLEQYQQRVQNMQEKISDDLGNLEVSVSRFYGSGRVQIDTIFSFSGAILQELGLSAPPQQLKLATSPDRYAVEISLEKVDLLEADVLFVMLDPGAEESFEKYQQSPLWQTLNVVKKERVYIVDSGYWYSGNILAANAILDDISKFLLEGSELDHEGNS